MKRRSEEFEAIRTVVYDMKKPMPSSEIADEASKICGSLVTVAVAGQILGELRKAKLIIKIIVPKISDYWFTSFKRMPPEFATRRLET